MSIPIPSTTSSLLDGGIGIVPASLANTHFKVGTCSLGTAGSFYPFQGTDTNNVKTTLGKGPVVDATIDSLIKSGGKQCIVHVPAMVTTAGSSSAVTAAGTSPPAITLTGAPYNASVSKIRTVLAGARGTWQFQYSLDNGNNWSPTITSAATYLDSNGVTINIANTAATLDNTWTWTDTAPVMSSSDLSAAYDAIIASQYQARWVHVVGQPADSATLLTIATMADGKMVTAYAAKKPMWTLLEAPAVDGALVVAAFNPAFASDYVVIAGGFCDYTNTNGGTVDKVSVGRGMAGRIARTPLGVDHSRLTDDSDLSSMSGVVRLVPNGAAASTGYHDEYATPLFQAGRVSSECTIPGVDGFFITTMLTMAQSTSDFQQLALLQIALEAVALYNAWAAKYLNARIRKQLATGFIQQAVADALDDQATAFILAGLKNENGDYAVDGLRTIINTADNLSLDPTLRGKIRMIPPSFARTISFDIGFTVALT